MQISQYEWDEINKKIACLEQKFKIQYGIFIDHLKAHDKDIKIEIINAISTEDQKEEKVTKFDVIRGMTDIKKFSDLMFDLVSHAGTSEDLAKLLAEGMTDEGLQNLESIAQSGYPLFLNEKKL
mgnify:CR=1 FL=1